MFYDNLKYVPYIYGFSPKNELPFALSYFGYAMTMICSKRNNKTCLLCRMMRLWKQELEKRGEKKASFVNVWIKFIMTRILLALVVLTIYALTSLSSYVSFILP